MRRYSIPLFVAICVLSGSMWLLPVPEADLPSSLLSFAISATVAAIGIVLAVRWLPVSSPLHKLRRGRLCCFGIGAISLPVVFLLSGRAFFNGVMAVAVQAGTPVVVAIASGALDDGGDAQADLPPALLALAGTLLVLPVALPASSRGWIGFGFYLAALLAGGVFTMAAHLELRRAGVRGLPNVATANMGFLWVAFASALIGSESWSRSLGTALSVASVSQIAATTMVSVASILLLYQLPPLALTSRFVFVPLLAAIEAYALMRPTVSFRTGSGAVLMVVGGVACFASAMRRAGERHTLPE